jgi:hypothetical protein
MPKKRKDSADEADNTKRKKRKNTPAQKES